MQLVHGPHLEEDTGVFLSRIYFPVPSLSLTNWPTEQSELPGVEIETLKSRGEWASAWTSNRLSPCASPFIREIASQHHALTSYWTKLGHRVIVKPQGRLEKTVYFLNRAIKTHPSRSFLVIHNPKIYHGLSGEKKGKQ